MEKRGKLSQLKIEKFSLKREENGEITNLGNYLVKVTVAFGKFANDLNGRELSDLKMVVQDIQEAFDKSAVKVSNFKLLDSDLESDKKYFDFYKKMAKHLHKYYFKFLRVINGMTTMGTKSKFSKSKLETLEKIKSVCNKLCNAIDKRNDDEIYEYITNVIDATIDYKRTYRALDIIDDKSDTIKSVENLGNFIDTLSKPEKIRVNRVKSLVKKISKNLNLPRASKVIGNNS